MKQISVIKAVLRAMLIGATGLMVACSSSDSGVSTTAISGTIVAAPVGGAEVNVTDVNGNVVAGPVNTDSNGQYSLNIPNSSLTQDLVLKSTGGTFIDEATGNDGMAGEIFAYVLADSLSSGSSVSATPGSTIIANLVMNHNKTMAQAQEAFTNAFGYTPNITITPADATRPAADATDAAKLAGFRAAAFSQLAMDLGLSQNNQFAMFAALAKDLSDGALNGIDASGAVDIGATGFALEANIQNRFAMALVNFRASNFNQTLLDTNQIGNLPFAKVALTNTYQIEYKQLGMMGAMEGKTTFQMHVTYRSDGSNAVGLATMLMPMMHMSGGMSHSAPKLACVDAAAGDYECTVYYLMASQMMDGSSMGYWDLAFTVAGEEAHFYPAVMMAMGDTAKVRLKGQADVIKDMMGMDVSRDYFIFKDSLMGAGPYTFTMFIAAKETMMSFPAVIVGNPLKLDMMGMITPMPVDSVAVMVSVDGGANWSPAIDGLDGTWSVSGLSLTAGVENQIRVRLTVNGEVKTTDGSALDAGVNDYQTFTVTPGGM